MCFYIPKTQYIQIHVHSNTVTTNEKTELVHVFTGQTEFSEPAEINLRQLWSQTKGQNVSVYQFVVYVEY